MSTLKRAARKMERSWRKTKLEVFRIAWRENTLSYRKALKTARSAYFTSLRSKQTQPQVFIQYSG